MKQSRWMMAGLCVALLTSESVVRAALWNVSDARFGDNALTLDSRTGLSWLNLSLTRGLSYQQMQVGIQSGGLFDGFRSASAAEVSSLFESAGIPAAGFYPESSPGAASVVALISLIGATSNGYGRPEAIGIAGTGPYAGLRYVPNLNFYSAGGVLGYGVSCPPSPTLLYGDGTGFDSVGNWLVAVPEPGTGALMLLGLAVIGRRLRAS